MIGKCQRMYKLKKPVVEVPRVKCMAAKKLHVNMAVNIEDARDVNDT